VELKAVCFSNEMNGWIIGSYGTVLHTTNGGAQWTSQYSGVSTDLTALAVFDSATAWTVGTGNVILRTGNDSGGVIESTQGRPSDVTSYSLNQNYPNPFNPSTTIRFSVPERSQVRVTIFNLLGQQIAELANEEMSAGNFERVWNANVASGLYFYRLEAVSVSDPSKRFVGVKKMVLMK
jgi:hypothetical protein